VLRVSMAVMTIAALIIGFSDVKWQLQIGIVVYGIANGMTSPTLFAWATDLSDENHKGRGLASLYIFMELGIGIGALAGGWIYSNDASQFPLVFGICSAFCFVALIYLFSLRPKSQTA
jgi:MFS family permease